jgi:hypothetical protein
VTLCNNCAAGYVLLPGRFSCIPEADIDANVNCPVDKGFVIINLLPGKKCQPCEVSLCKRCDPNEYDKCLECDAGLNYSLM